MISFEIDKNAIKQICDHLNELQDKSPQALKNAINRTAREARKWLFKQVKKEYAFKNATDKLKESHKIKNATPRRLEATITFYGKVMQLGDFQFDPEEPLSTFMPGSTTKGKVLSKNPMKNLEKGGIKAFTVKFESGHIAVAQRTHNYSGYKYAKEDKKPNWRIKQNPDVKVLFSSSLPKMMGDEKNVYGVVAPRIQEALNNEVKKAINKIAERYANK